MGPKRERDSGIFELLSELSGANRPPAMQELGAPPAELHPDLHERQIEENLQWQREREQRVLAHIRRVQEHLRKHARRKGEPERRHGARRQVWCVELRRRFDSVTEAAGFVARAPTNITQAIRLGCLCAGFHWERFDAARHAAAGNSLPPDGEHPMSRSPEPPPPRGDGATCPPSGTSLVKVEPSGANRVDCVHNATDADPSPTTLGLSTLVNAMTLQPKSLVLVNHHSPGDVLMLTAAVRDLHAAYPGQYRTAVDTYCPDLWQNNPWVVPSDSLGSDVLRIDCNHPPLLDRCNDQPGHYVGSMHAVIERALERPVPVTRFAPDLHLSEEERSAPPHGVERPYWLVVAGGKRDMTTKWWPTSSYQQVVEHFRGKIHFVQAGAGGDHHPGLSGVENLVGRTSLRELMCLVYHAEGVVCTVTCAMHAAAALDRPCVVIAGGREPPHWEMYPTHQYLHTVGQFACCRHGGCWRARVVPLGDGDADRDGNLCVEPKYAGDDPVAACMASIGPQDVVRAVERYHIASEAERQLEGERVLRLTQQNAAPEMDRIARSLSEYPGGFEGRGIVIPGGGHKYFPCAWVCVNAIRDTGCTLPIELWHLGPAEMSRQMRELVEPLGVRCVDALAVREQHPARSLGGWELKAFAPLHSQFREVIVLDADNFPLIDPAELFETSHYRERGAIFWPDYGSLGPEREVWRLTGVPYRPEPEFETGQMLIDKGRCWRPLSLAMWMNEHSDFWYRHIYGDKDTFHLAWRKLGMEYAMPPHAIVSLDGVMCQHDFQGRRIFQHRNSHKWRLVGKNRRISGFEREERGLELLAELRHRWTERFGKAYRDSAAAEPLRRAARRLCSCRWTYRRIGYDERPMSFTIDGMVDEGAAGCEETWDLHLADGQLEFSIWGNGQCTCVLTADAEGTWRGRWLVNERMPVEIVPPEPSGSGQSGLQCVLINAA